MYRLTWIFLLCFAAIIGYQKLSSHPSDLPQDQFIQVYFNHRETGKQTYIDPYRQVEREGDDLETIIIEEIATAKSTIDLAVHELNLPSVAQALVESHRSGVKVRVILDNNYSQPLSSLSSSEISDLKPRDRLKYDAFLTLVDQDKNGYLSTGEISQGDALVVLQDAGISIIDDTADGSKGSGLMHHKFMVVDGKTVITGSANFTLSDIHGDFNNLDTRGNVNHLLRINNQDVANLFSEEFNYMWGDDQAGGVNSQFGLAKPERSPVDLIWQNTTITLQFAPTSNRQDWSLSSNGSIGKAISNANSSVDLALFVFSDQSIANTLQQKQEQEVKISGVFDSGFAFRYYSEVLDLLGVTVYNRCQAEDDNNPWLQPLETVGVGNIAMGDKLHHKFALIDQQTIISGSHNWSEAANHTNDETLIIINNLTLAQHFNREFQRLYQSAFLGLSPTIKQKIDQQQQDCQ
jgi:phosphatidylserine/phosphatidylglycerophosphate/cardiolipin synthase-like enzyme